MMFQNRYSPRRHTSYSPIQAPQGRRNSIIPNQQGAIFYTTTKVDNIKQEKQCYNQQQEQQQQNQRIYPVRNFNQTQHISPIKTHFDEQRDNMYNIRNSQQKTSVQETFIPIELQKMKLQLQQKDQELINTKKLLKLEVDERIKLRVQLESKTEDQLCKEREITKLLSVVHQMQGNKRIGDNSTVKQLQNQVETLEKYISKLTKTTNKEDEMKMQVPNCQNRMQDQDCRSTYQDIRSTYQSVSETTNLKNQLSQMKEEKGQFLSELEKLTCYLNNLVKENGELQLQYQEKCIEVQKYKLLNEEIGILEQELRGKADEVKQLKDQIYQVKIAESVSKDGFLLKSEDTHRDQLQLFLERIKQNYISKEVTLGDDDGIQTPTYQQKIYSFESRMI